MTEPRFWVLYLTGLLLASLGCMPGDNNGDGATDVAGIVGGTDFTVRSSSADRGEDGTYVITLADTAEFSCTASSGLPMNYLQVVLGDVDSPGEYPADGRVFFNVFESGVSAGEAADEGTITIDDINFGTIDGHVDASGPESSVTGSFSAQICN